jgi:hypothetical protein
MIKPAVPGFESTKIVNIWNFNHFNIVDFLTVAVHKWARKLKCNILHKLTSQKVLMRTFVYYYF